MTCRNIWISENCDSETIRSSHSVLTDTKIVYIHHHYTEYSSIGSYFNIDIDEVTKL